MSKPNESAGYDSRISELNKPAPGRVRKRSKKKDQSNTPLFMGTAAGRYETAAAPLPLFMDALYKARDFDPL